MMTTAEWQQRMDSLLLVEHLGRYFSHFNQLVTERHQLRSWDDCKRWFESFPSQVLFRGQRKSSWNLDTSLDRRLRRVFSAQADGISFEILDLIKPDFNETKVLADFQRMVKEVKENARSGSLPQDDQTIDWLAWMQHHGAPTRLLDWTSCPYVALYFALKDEDEDGDDAALWAIDSEWLEERSTEDLIKHFSINKNGSDCTSPGSLVNSILLNTDNPEVIVRVRPEYPYSDRIIAQQGTFLCTLRHNPLAGFVSTLLSMALNPQAERQVISKVIVKRHERCLILSKLRDMKIHDATLFPQSGIDSLGCAVSTQLEMVVEQQIEALKEKMISEARTTVKRIRDHQEQHGHTSQI